MDLRDDSFFNFPDNHIYMRTKNQKSLPKNISDIEGWLSETFSSSHVIYLTDQSKPPPETQGLYTYVIVRKDVLEEKEALFWSDLLAS